MSAEIFDCPWCGSAKSIEHGLCQVCLMEFDVETKVINLPPRRRIHGHTVLQERPQGTAEAE
ncbi:MAG: hypothetical protein ACRDJ1_01400 [Actinomycetota bacterium]